MNTTCAEHSVSDSEFRLLELHRHRWSSLIHNLEKFSCFHFWIFPPWVIWTKKCAWNPMHAVRQLRLQVVAALRGDEQLPWEGDIPSHTASKLGPVLAMLSRDPLRRPSMHQVHASLIVMTGNWCMRHAMRHWFVSKAALFQDPCSPVASC